MRGSSRPGMTFPGVKSTRVPRRQLASAHDRHRRHTHQPAARSSSPSPPSWRCPTSPMSGWKLAQPLGTAWKAAGIVLLGLYALSASAPGSCRPRACCSARRAMCCSRLMFRRRHGRLRHRPRAATSAAFVPIMGPRPRPQQARLSRGLVLVVSASICACRRHGRPGSPPCPAIISGNGVLGLVVIPGNVMYHGHHLDHGLPTRRWAPWVNAAPMIAWGMPHRFRGAVMLHAVGSSLIAVGQSVLRQRGAHHVTGEPVPLAGESYRVW